MNTIGDVIRDSIRLKPAAILVCCFSLASCGGSGGSDSTVTDGDTANDGVNAGSETDVGGNDVDVVVSDQPTLSSGNVSMIGTVAVSDETGNVSDIVGSFFDLSEALSGDDLAMRFTALDSFCEVEPDVISDFADISVSFNPDIPGTDQAISAGDTVVLSEAAGTYVTLSQQGVGELVFYGTDSSVASPTGPVPEPLQAFVTGDVFPAFAGVTFPEITTLTGLNFGDSGDVTVNTQFTWNAASSNGTFIRILSSTQGGFFLDDSLRVTCLVQDNGSFTFPAEIQAALGQDYVGGAPIVSRVAVSTVVDNDAALFIVRESFAD